MSLAKNYASRLHQQLKLHAAWLPVANTFRVGNYGLIEGGVLRPLGHITDDFGVDTGKLEESDADAEINFESDGVTAVRMVAGAKVNAFPQNGSVDATLEFEFREKDSVLVRAPKLRMKQMPSVQIVANELALAPGWRKAFRVVSAVYSAETSVVLLASEAGTKIALNAKVDALRALELGNAQASITVSASSERSFRSIGKAGVLGLSLFKLGLFGGLDLLRIDAGEEAQLEDDL